MAPDSHFALPETDLTLLKTLSELLASPIDSASLFNSGLMNNPG